MQGQAKDRLIFALGCITIVGCLIVIITDVVAGTLVNDYSMVADSISDLAAGERSWILDFGLQAFALSFLTCSIGLFLWNYGDWSWRAGCILLATLSVAVYFIATHNAYGDGVPGGFEIHIYLVLYLGVVFAVVCWLLASDFKKLNASLSSVSKRYGVAWLVLSPIFFILPNNIDGLYERGLALMLIIWLIAMSWLMMKHNRLN